LTKRNTEFTDHASKSAALERLSAIIARHRQRHRLDNRSATFTHRVARGTHHAELAISALKLHVEALMHGAGYQDRFFGALRESFGLATHARRPLKHEFENGARATSAAAVPA